MNLLKQKLQEKQKADANQDIFTKINLKEKSYASLLLNALKASVAHTCTVEIEFNEQNNPQIIENIVKKIKTTVLSKNFMLEKVSEYISPITEDNKYYATRMSWSAASSVVTHFDHTPDMKDIKHVIDVLVKLQAPLDELKEFSLKNNLSMEDIENYQHGVNDLVENPSWKGRSNQENFNLTVQSAYLNALSPINSHFWAQSESAVKTAAMKNVNEVIFQLQKNLLTDELSNEQKLYLTQSCITHGTKIFKSISQKLLSTLGGPDLNMLSKDAVNFIDQIGKKALLAADIASQVALSLRGSLTAQIEETKGIVNGNVEKHDPIDAIAKINAGMPLLYASLLNDNEVYTSGVSTMLINNTKLMSNAFKHFRSSADKFIDKNASSHPSISHYTFKSVIAALQRNRANEKINIEASIASSIDLGCVFCGEIKLTPTVCKRIGLNPEELDDIRNKIKNLSFINDSEYVNIKIKLAIVSALVESMSEISEFKWGIHEGYCAKHIINSIINLTKHLTDSNLPKLHGDAANFEYFLTLASKTYCNQWHSEASVSLKTNITTYTSKKVEREFAEEVLKTIDSQAFNACEQYIQDIKSANTTLEDKWKLEPFMANISPKQAFSAPQKTPTPPSLESSKGF